MTTKYSPRLAQFRRWWSGSSVLILAAMLVLSGCETLEETVDTLDPFSEDTTAESDSDEGATFDEEGPSTGEDEPIPNLASVPEKPQPSSTSEQRRTVATELVADREKAKYTKPIELPESASMPPPPPPAPKSPPAVPPEEVMVETLAPTASATASAASAKPALPAPSAPSSAPPTPQAVVTPGLPSPIPMAPAVAPGPAVLKPGSTLQMVYQQQLALSAPRPPAPIVAPSASLAPASTPSASALPPPAPITPSASAEAMVVGTPRGLEEYRVGARAISSNIATIYFSNNSARLSSRDRVQLQQVASRQREVDGALRVIGHASSRTRDMDPVRHKLVNFKISVDRATAVSEELMRYGVSPDALYVGAVSDAEPVTTEIMPADEVYNRRVEIFLDY